MQISERARRAGVVAVLSGRGGEDNSATGAVVYHVLHGGAPIVVAAELRRCATEIRRQGEKAIEDALAAPPGLPQTARLAIGDAYVYVAESLESRAAALDPEGAAA